MGKYVVRCSDKFYASVVIDIATLPKISAGGTISEGQIFIVRGSGFLAWPHELVLAASEQYAINFAAFDERYPSILTLISKTNSVLEFRANYTQTFGEGHVWQYFAAPYETPRIILDYTTRE